MEESYICLAETVSILFCCICCISYISVGDNKKRKENNRKVLKEKRRKEKILTFNPIYGHDMTHLLLCLVLSCLALPCLVLPYLTLSCLAFPCLEMPCDAFCHTKLDFCPLRTCVREFVCKSVPSWSLMFLNFLVVIDVVRSVYTYVTYHILFHSSLLEEV